MIIFSGGFLDSSYVLALLVGSVTGQGLVLTIYSLLVSRAEELLEYRADLLREVKLQFEEHKKNLEPQKLEKLSDEELRKRSQELKSDLEKIKEYRGLPPYLGASLLGSFVFYGLTTLMSLGWFWIAEPQKEQLGMALTYSFLLATLIFLFMGGQLISDLRSSLKRKRQGRAKPIDVLPAHPPA